MENNKRILKELRKISQNVRQLNNAMGYLIGRINFYDTFSQEDEDEPHNTPETRKQRLSVANIRQRYIG